MDIVGRLIEAGASVNLQMEDGTTPLQMAQEKNNAEVETLLMAHGAQ